MLVLVLLGAGAGPWCFAREDVKRFESRTSVINIYMRMYCTIYIYIYIYVVYEKYKGDEGIVQTRLFNYKQKEGIKEYWLETR